MPPHSPSCPISTLLIIPSSNHCPACSQHPADTRTQWLQDMVYFNSIKIPNLISIHQQLMSFTKALPQLTITVTFMIPHTADPYLQKAHITPIFYLPVTSTSSRFNNCLGQLHTDMCSLRVADKTPSLERRNISHFRIFVLRLDEEA